MSTATATNHSNDERLLAKRFEGVQRPYSTADVERLRGSVKVEHTLAKLGANRLW